MYTEEQSWSRSLRLAPRLSGRAKRNRELGRELRRWRSRRRSKKFLRIAFRQQTPVNMRLPFHCIDDPKLANTEYRIEPRLETEVVVETRVGDLNH